MGFDSIIHALQAAYTRTIEAIYSAINATVAKNCDKENEGAFHAELKLRVSCQLAVQPMPIY